MGILAIVVGAAVTFAFGAFWYGVFSDAWKSSSQVPLDAEGNPQNMRSPVPYVTCAIALILVAGMMRHSFATAGIDTFGKGIISGAGVGLFFVTPWIALFHGYSMHSHRLTLINGGYATIGCALMGAALTVL
ncbi:DUF1761 domain-containing protein [Pseudooctadecabacter jejudonensis]|uniref:DUF1761 domain-containing protein n=1 Tax=Pseudooctadecabacter jejudonensis TaxID=1391910 RepID=A0A1Y5S9P8_9RHOB|nr:DUF1761 domain-containing protein [Pseudooctadecabacter jejudonensis]SLN33179.1 hypothetical protein PSJ8397_01586 [Pseudooctadecabacter jejudonensis]